MQILKWLATRLRKGSQFRSCALWEDASCPGLIHESALQSRPLLAAVSAFKVDPLNHRSQRTRRLLPSRTPACEAPGDPYDDTASRGACRDTAAWVPGWLQAGRQGGPVVFTPTGLFKQSGCLYKLTLSSQTSSSRSVLMRRGERDVTIITIMIWNKKYVDLNMFGGVVVKLAKERIMEKLDST